MSPNQVLNNQKDNKVLQIEAFSPGFRISILLTIFVFAAIIFISTWSHAASARIAASQVSQEIVYPVVQFDDGKARFYEFKTDDGVKIKYFVLKSSDGVIRAAFDSCVVCWREGKGYKQSDDLMVCNNCGRRFQSVKINVITGGCNPAPLDRKTENGKVILKADDILKGKQFFAKGER